MRVPPREINRYTAMQHLDSAIRITCKENITQRGMFTLQSALALAKPVHRNKTWSSSSRPLMLLESWSRIHLQFPLKLTDCADGVGRSISFLAKKMGRVFYVVWYPCSWTSMPVFCQQSSTKLIVFYFITFLTLLVTSRLWRSMSTALTQKQMQLYFAVKVN